MVTLVKHSHTQGLRILICRTGSITPSFEVCVRITGHKDTCGALSSSPPPPPSPIGWKGDVSTAYILVGKE